MMDQNKFLKQIKQYIKTYDGIYVVSYEDDLYTSVLRNILSFPTNKYLLLVTGTEKEWISMLGADIRPISDEEYRAIENLYHLYEFSDQVHFPDGHAVCGSLKNYINSGLLTENEAAMVLLK